VSTPIRQYVRELDIDAYVVGGAVRDELLGLPHNDEDFLVLGVDHGGLRALLAPYGRVDDLAVHGQLVGVRLHPRDKAIRALAPAGIEFTPPRTERSIGPGHRHFEIVTDASLTLEQDMARRDFTINAMARRLATGELVDPFGGREDLERRVLRTVSAQSFREDPLRIIRALRFVSQLGVALTEDTEHQMRCEAGGLVHVSAERIGGGLAADSMGELSKLLLGADPGRALRLARDVGVLAVVLPELEAVVGLELDDPRQPLTVDEHTIEVVRGTADAGSNLALRLAALLHDTGKAEALRTGASHAEIGARLADGALTRLRYPTAMRRHVVALIRAHSFTVPAATSAADARRFLAKHGDELALELAAFKAADCGARIVTDDELAALAAFGRALAEQRGSAHRISDLDVDGSDLIAVGIPKGPEVGRVLGLLLDDVLTDPASNERELLLARARRELA
jgi:tRNA nucleotidyltransferase (CCA-adding enzyme)